MPPELAYWLERLWPWIGLAAGIVGSAFFSGSETGAYRLNRVRLRLARRQGRPGAELLGRMLRDMTGLICAILIGNNIANYLATATATVLLARNLSAGGGHYVELLATVIMAPVLFIFAETVPKNVYNIEADRLMYRSARPLWTANVLFRVLGLVGLLKGISGLWARLARRFDPMAVEHVRDPFPARARLRSIIRDSAAEGIMTPYQNELVEKIMTLRTVRVSDAMVPLRQVATLREGTGPDQFREAARRHPYTRLPVTDRTGRQVVGILRVYDVLMADEGDEPLDPMHFVRPAVELAPTMTITQAIFALQAARTPMAVVRDPQRRSIGIITLKDLVEEIVGELEAW